MANTAFESKWWPLRHFSLGAMIQKGDLSHAERIQLHQTHCKGKNKFMGKKKKASLKGSISYIKSSPAPAPLNCSYLSTSRPPSQHPSVVCVFVKEEIDPFLLCWGFFHFSKSNIILWHQSDGSTRKHQSRTQRIAAHACVVLQFTLLKWGYYVCFVFWTHISITVLQKLGKA